jgi:hypothetical protein
MAWEAERIGRPERRQLATLVARHRLLAEDPLAIEDPTDGRALEDALLELG